MDFVYVNETILLQLVTHVILFFCENPARKYIINPQVVTCEEAFFLFV